MEMSVWLQAKEQRLQIWIEGIYPNGRGAKSQWRVEWLPRGACLMAGRSGGH